MSEWQQKWQAWRDMTVAMQTEIKTEAAEKVKSHLLASEFEQAIQVIHETEALVAELDLTEKWAHLERKLADFSSTMKAESKPFQAGQLSQIEEQRKEAPKGFAAETVKEEAKQLLAARDFSFVGETDTYIHFVKASRNYYLNLFHPAKEKDELRQELEAMRQYKNIGWICRNQNESAEAKKIIDEWLEELEPAKKKFLTMNLAVMTEMKANPAMTFQ
ncbi:hypothetical protein [Listeria grayi]|uniref:Uncharacterized protein n=1 Tax=Listeria grayi DSM 20601 TaxID=525367 RepID=D7V0G8_LISGR|nr:hypothetical protein [Listeria grayi]EFI83061.1 hypothetical protein HMPREF0556_11746 [Listeria grayi DSM 20601]